jgi:hypothetical protein
MNQTQPTTHRVGRMVDATHSLEMKYLPVGVPCEGGRTYHILSQVCDDGTVCLLARIDATVVNVVGTATILWYINAPAIEYDMPHVWMAVRSWSTEGDAIDALWRLRGLAQAGQLPNDLRDAI